MATLPQPKAATREEWIPMPRVEDSALHIQLDSQRFPALCSSCARIIRKRPGGILKPKLFPRVQLDIALVWPD